MGYPFRFLHDDFIKRYGIIMNIKFDGNKAIVNILETAKYPKTDYQIGVTKVFFRKTDLLEVLRNKLITVAVIKIQKTYRMWREKKI